MADVGLLYPGCHSMSSISVQFCSPPDREKMIAAIMIDGEQLAEINQEHESLGVELYPRRNGEPWVLDLEEFMDAVGRAEKGLVPS
jgi:hypothetical protein